MAMLFRLGPGDHIDVHPLPATGTLRLDADGAVNTDRWVVALVAVRTTAGAPARHAVIARPGAAVRVGAHRPRAGVTILHHADHLLLGARELIFSSDGIPTAAADIAVCPICAEPTGADATAYRCPRCGGTACATCWTTAPNGVCPTQACDQPAALDRTAWTPRPEHFVSCEYAA